MPEPRAALADPVMLPLLTRISQESFDEDYLHVAERRSAQGTPPARRGHWTAAAVVVVFGILATTAAVQTSRNADVDDASRTSLVSRILARRESVSRLQDRIVRLREQNLVLSDELSRLTRSEQSAVARLRRIEVATGFIAVTGEGVRIVVDDAPQGDETQVVRDEDLAMLVDGLWNAGAEAIAVNGQRLTVLSAFRNVDVAVHLNSRPLSPPYTVLAIGDTQTLQSNLLDTTHGLAFAGLVDQLGFVFDMQNEQSLTLPAARLGQLRSVMAGTAADIQDKRTNEESTP